MHKHDTRAHEHSSKRLEVAAICLAVLVAVLSFDKNNISEAVHQPVMAQNQPSVAVMQQELKDDIEATKQDMLLHD